MTIEQAIDDLMDASRSIAEVAESESDEANRINAQNVADDCKQLAAWLRKLHGRRKEQEIATGEWVLKEHLWECNKCGCRINVANPLSGNNWNYYFCPHCGTKMIIAVQRF